MNKVTVVLNGYKRPHVLTEQYEAYCKQSAGRPEFMFWANLERVENIPFDKNVVNHSTSALCNHNLGVWARFAFALNARTEYICVADDDTVPGSRWLENCLTAMDHVGNAVLTTRGVRIKNNNYPQPDSYDVFGWSHPNEIIEEVDFGGHCWFFHKSLLKLFWAYSPDFPPLNYGEDMHLSFAASKHGIKTYVPPHPAHNEELYGSIRELGLDYGQDAVATSRLPEASRGMNEYFNAIVSAGYQRVMDRQNGNNQTNG
jgi:cellulose synthase/poly-beta-1,6-N-acetylglucosamine synthase-like glycosyltransferase